MNIKKYFFLLIIILVIPSLSLSQQVKLKKIKLGYATTSAASSSLWITMDTGKFKKYGLDVEMVYMRGGSRVMWN